MAIVYRVEKKKIIISQLRLIEWLKSKEPNQELERLNDWYFTSLKK